MFEYYTKSCELCGRSYSTTADNAKYCSLTCKQNAYRRARRTRERMSGGHLPLSVVRTNFDPRTLPPDQPIPPAVLRNVCVDIANLWKQNGIAPIYELTAAQLGSFYPTWPIRLFRSGEVTPDGSTITTRDPSNVILAYKDAYGVYDEEPVPVATDILSKAGVSRQSFIPAPTPKDEDTYPFFARFYLRGDKPYTKPELKEWLSAIDRIGEGKPVLIQNSILPPNWQPPPDKFRLEQLIHDPTHSIIRHVRTLPHILEAALNYQGEYRLPSALSPTKQFTMEELAIQKINKRDGDPYYDGTQVWGEEAQFMIEWLKTNPRDVELTPDTPHILDDGSQVNCYILEGTPRRTPLV